MANVLLKMISKISGTQPGRSEQIIRGGSWRMAAPYWMGALLLCLSLSAFAQQVDLPPRIKVSLNNQWSFTTDSAGKGPGVIVAAQWQAVRLPHTWNVEDVLDDEPGYYRGVGWYRSQVRTEDLPQYSNLALHFEGANQVAEVYVNGKKAGAHSGGYTAFTIPIRSYLRFDLPYNEILVKVDNSHNEGIPPLSADFTFYGGIYRDVFLVGWGAVHFSEHYGASGVFLSTPKVSEAQATLQVKAVVANETRRSRRLKMSTLLRDREGREVAASAQVFTVPSLAERTLALPLVSVEAPSLWSPEEPYLYDAVVRITDEKDGTLLDEHIAPVGFRFFHFDAAEGFFLNGQPYKLIGASRHQDYPLLGNALPDSLAVRDVALLKKMGGNFLRVAHYPQDPSVLEACDRLGLLASVEIPIVNEITESEAFYRQSETMLREMIRQNFNHPSVIIWCYMNEVLLRPHYPGDKKQQQQYFSNVTGLARRLEVLTRQEDPARYTMMAYHGDFNRYEQAGLLSIPMIAGWNLYSGWYGGELHDFGAFLDNFHRRMPRQPLMVAEYGADADPRIRSQQPVRFDKSVEYVTAFHQHYLKEIRQRPFVAGGLVWNLADFNSETRAESMPHINNKGLLEWDRTPKDPYYFYQAALLPGPFLKILGTGYIRTGVAEHDRNTSIQLLEAASNADSIQLSVNDTAWPWMAVKEGLCRWEVPFLPGNNLVVAKAIHSGQVLSDTARIKFLMQPGYFDKDTLSFTPLHILLGANRFFTDSAHVNWMPSQPYQPGSWGSVGGRPFTLAGNSRLPYGSDKNIRGTDNDPLYQTQQVGIRQYRLDVPPGTYTLTLHFAELQGIHSADLPYNLSQEVRREDAVNRSFNVRVNNRLVLEDFDIARSYGLATAAVKTITVEVIGQEGITLDFEALSGEPVLNALEVQKTE